jgi:hypothetical protein
MSTYCHLYFQALGGLLFVQCPIKRTVLGTFENFFLMSVMTEEMMS